MQYLVTWTIDMEADSSEEAARLAFAIQQDRETQATYFVVKNQKTGAETGVDCLSLEDEEGYVNTPCKICGNTATPSHVGGHCGPEVAEGPI